MWSAGCVPSAKRSSRPNAKPIRIGAFKELGFDDDPAAPSLSSVRGKRGSEHKTSVVAYLRGGHTTAYCVGLEADVFDETKLAGSLSVRTDGTYAWPELLAYYVEHYDIALPEDFEEHMRANRWQVPKQPTSSK